MKQLLCKHKYSVVHVLALLLDGGVGGVLWFHKIRQMG